MFTPVRTALRLAALHAKMRHIAATKRPIILGPFRSELGFEVLYWIPFLHWLQSEFGIDKKRCIALSRGGMGALYPAEAWDDLYSLRTVDEVRLENAVDFELQKMQKQKRITPWDRDVCDALARRNRFGRYHVLHPSLMYQLFQPVWDERAPMRTLHQRLRFEPLPAPKPPDTMKLPDRYVAVRFYDRFTLPLTKETKEQIRIMVAHLASHVPVVMITSPYFADDHVDLRIEGPNIIQMPQVPAHENLLLQCSVIAHAQAFVGTYGGVAQWALRYGKPSLSFYTHFNGTAFVHRTISDMIAAHTKVPFELLSLPGLDLVRSVMLKAPEPQHAPKPEAPTPAETA